MKAKFLPIEHCPDALKDAEVVMIEAEGGVIVAAHWNHVSLQWVDNYHCKEILWPKYYAHVEFEHVF